VLFLGGFISATTVPFIEFPLRTLYERSGEEISPKHFIRISLELEKGTIEFSYSSSRIVDAFIMATEQYYGFAESISGYTGSEDAILDSTSGRLTCEVKQRTTYYFVILNENDRPVTIGSFIIKHTSKQTLLEIVTRK
jgi:hypothetical protein